MNCSIPGLPVHHQLPELIQTHVQWVSDAIQSSHPLTSPSPTFSLSQHQDLFQMSQLFASGNQSIGISASASVLPINIQDWFPLRMDWLDLLVVQGTLKSLFQHHRTSSQVPLFYNLFRKLYHIKIKADPNFERNWTPLQGHIFLKV